MTSVPRLHKFFKPAGRGAIALTRKESLKNVSLSPVSF
jgi:hypothetical protein